MKRILSTRRVAIACALSVIAAAGTGAACAQPEEQTVQASVCDGSPLVQATVTVERVDGRPEVSVAPDPIDLCVDGEPSVARWVLDDKTGEVEKWDVQGNATKDCASGGSKAPLSFEVAHVGDSWIGDRNSRRAPADGDCWVYDVIVEIGGDVIVLDPEIDWGR